jgi:hypothetical protein
MITQTKEVYKCEHCRKMYQRKEACLNHELRCGKNPDNIRACHGCSVLTKVATTVWAGYGDMNGNEQERVVDVLFCKKIDCFIHPPSVAIKGNAFEMGNKDNLEMPKSCSLKETNWIELD